LVPSSGRIAEELRALACGQCPVWGAGRLDVDGDHLEELISLGPTEEAGSAHVPDHDWEADRPSIYGAGLDM
jgi:hypothetical protein